MMTKLTGDKKVIRETAVLDRGRPIVIELEPKYLRIRLKGERRALPLSYEELMWFACRREAERRQRERATGRKSSRGRASSVQKPPGGRRRPGYRTFES